MYLTTYSSAKNVIYCKDHGCYYACMHAVVRDEIEFIIYTLLYIKIKSNKLF